MVFTRSQKRKSDENDDNIQLDNEYSSIKVYTKRKKSSYENKEDKNKEDKNKEDKNKEDKDKEDKDKEDKDKEDKNKEHHKNEYYIDENSESKSFITTDENASENTCENTYQSSFEETSSDVDNYLTNVIENAIRGVVKKEYKRSNNNDMVFKDEYDKYLYNLSNIYSGNFFQTFSKDEQKQKLEENFSIDYLRFLTAFNETIGININTHITELIDEIFKLKNQNNSGL